MEHQYLVTEAIPEIAALGGELPLLREVDVSYYLRQEAQGLLLGPYERGAKPFGVGGIPPAFGADLLPPDPERLRSIVEGAMARVPVLARAGIQRIVNGPITYTPDGNPLIGPAFGLPGFWLACGLSFGITQAGGAGQYLAEWIVEGQPSIDLWEIDPRRYGTYATERYAVARCIDIYEDEYAIVYPQDDRRPGRPARTSPLYDRFRGAGAVFGVRNGWERPYWFAPVDGEPRDRPSFRRTNWFDAVGREARAVRERAGLLELSSFAKYEVHGPGAEALLDRLCANRLPRLGQIALSQLLTPCGMIECDVTVTRLEPERFLVLSAAVAELHDLDWLRRHAPADGSVVIENVTPRWGVLILAGPCARDILARLTDADLSNEGCPYLHSREIWLASAPVRASRITYVGELGWELYVPAEFAPAVHDALVAAGSDLGLRHAGYHAMDSLRIEKAYRSWGHDVGPEDTPLEAGLGFAVALDKPVPFIGREALLAERDAPLSRRLVVFLLEDPEPLLYHDEPIWRGGALLGRISSGAYGHTLGRAIGLGYVEHPDGVDEAFVASGRGEIEVAGRRWPARAQLQPPYDPKSLRVRA